MVLRNRIRTPCFTAVSRRHSGRSQTAFSRRSTTAVPLPYKAILVSFCSSLQELSNDTSFINFGWRVAIMPRPSSAVIAFRDTITSQTVQGIPQSEILAGLARRGVSCDVRTLRRYLRQWGVVTMKETTRAAPAQPGIS
jgi:hypothetical protein